jgi:hypothetical protein
MVATHLILKWQLKPAMITFLVSEGEATLDVCTVQWWIKQIKESETGGAEIQDKQ